MNFLILPFFAAIICMFIAVEHGLVNQMSNDSENKLNLIQYFFFINPFDLNLYCISAVGCFPKITLLLKYQFN